MPRPHPTFNPMMKAKSKGTSASLSRNPAQRMALKRQIRSPKDPKKTKKKRSTIKEKEKERDKKYAKKQRTQSAIARLSGDSKYRKGNRKTRY